MKIQDLLQKNAILPDIAQTNKNEVLQLMATFMATLYGLPEGEDIALKIIERETDMSTGIGYGIAIPHARIPGIDRLYLVVGRSFEGIEFKAIDELPVHLLFMMLSPKNTSAEHTQILSTLSRIMSYEEVRTKLLEVKNAEGMLEVIIKSENKYAD
ncbi:MAG: PTS sugar transporter subunit IIA [Chitinispirillaceae bacterium]|nr:PTS sugar transporter subunit IIA [Chitinispirillaceae bacterium]